jgi:Mrp family chromosome partitioning ATPase
MDEKIDYETVKGQLEMLLLKATLRGIMIGAEWQKHNSEELKTAKDLAKSIGVRVKVRRKKFVQPEVPSL